MADNKVKFLRGTAAEYEASTKDNDVFYYVTDTKKLYLGANEVTGVGKAGTGASAEIFNDYTQNKANGNYSHAEGLYTKADGSAIRKVRIPTLPGIILILKVIVQQHQSFLLMPGETHRVL